MTTKKESLIKSVSDLIGNDTAEKREKRLKKSSDDKKLHQKERWKELYHSNWKEEFNAKRRTQYAADEDFRNSVKAQNRMYYRKKKPQMSTGVDCRVGLMDRFSQFGETKKVYLTKTKLVDKLTFNKNEASQVLCMSEVTLWKYLKAGLLPAPIYEFAVMNNGTIYRKAKQKVYTSEELYIIADVLGDHYTRCHKYTREDKDVAFKIITRINNIRGVLEKS